MYGGGRVTLMQKRTRSIFIPINKNIWGSFGFFSRRMFSEAGQDCFQRWQHTSGAFGANDPIPERLEFLPAARITDVAQPPEEVVFGPRALKDRTPAIEIAIGAPVTSLHILRRHPGGA